jgi:tetratricopeptide (TPR) repeat protein
VKAPPDTSEDTVQASVDAGPERLLPQGTVVGRYMLVGRIGAGGMGVVYQAYDPELHRRVAIKFLRASSDGSVEPSDGRSRLLREAQAIARLADPNVISVHDVGTFESQVFVAMELVDGETLTEWLRAAPRGWRDILSMFRQAGRGLAAAHAAGLVHRDFKPDNVLVGRDGRARVLDFGLVRDTTALAQPAETEPVPSVLPAELADGKTLLPDALSSPMTKTGVFMGTPSYMAPEQFLRQPADARTDQFSFCVALWQALYGERPFAGDNVVEIGMSVIEGRLREPPRKTKVPAWVRAVLTRGLSLDPAARHPSMDALLAALVDTKVERWRGVAAVALFAAIVIASAVVLWRGRTRGNELCGGAEDALADAWSPARAEAVHAAFAKLGKGYGEATYQAVAHALDDYARAWSAMHRDACVATRVRGTQSEDLLDLRMECLESRRQELRALSGLFTGADEKLLERALQSTQGLTPVASCGDVAALRTPVRLPSDPKTRDQVRTLRAAFAAAKEQFDAGRYKEAMAATRPLAEETHALGYRPLEAEVARLLGAIAVQLDDKELSRNALYQCVAAAEAGRADEERARCWITLIRAAKQSGQHDLELKYEAIADGALTRLGDPPYLRSMFESAVAARLRGGGDFAGAIGHEKKAVDLRIAALGPDAVQVAYALSNLGHSLDENGRYEEALAVEQRALAIEERTLGVDHPDIGYVLNHLGNVYEDLGRLEEADIYYRRALTVRERALGPESTSVADVLNNLGIVAFARKQYAPAADYARRSLAIRQKALGPDDADVAMSLDNLGAVLRAQHKYTEAMAAFKRALAIMEKQMGPSHPWLADALGGMGNVYLDEGDAAAARAPLERALALVAKASVRATDRADVQFTLARALGAAQVDLVRAQTLAESALRVYSESRATAAQRAEVEAWLAKNRVTSARLH